MGDSQWGTFKGSLLFLCGNICTSCRSCLTCGTAEHKRNAISSASTHRLTYIRFKVSEQNTGQKREQEFIVLYQPWCKLLPDLFLYWAVYTLLHIFYKQSVNVFLKYYYFYFFYVICDFFIYYYFHDWDLALVFAKNGVTLCLFFYILKFFNSLRCIETDIWAKFVLLFQIFWCSSDFCWYFCHSTIFQNFCHPSTIVKGWNKSHTPTACQRYIW